MAAAAATEQIRKRVCAAFSGGRARFLASIVPKGAVLFMELSAAHLRYLLAIYQTSHTQRDVSSRTIAERLGVTRPSVARALGQLMDRGMIVKAHYGKIYLTDRGIFVARRVQQQLDCVLEHFPPLALELTADEKHRAALALAAALPERLFTGEYERLFGPDDALTG